MMADHGDPCHGEEATYCMNGGTCYKIPSINTLSCVCNTDYKGSRCEHFLLQIKHPEARDVGLIAAVVIVVLLIIVVLAVIIYYLRKMLKTSQQSRQSNQGQYWKVNARV